jgi:MFS family permease
MTERLKSFNSFETKIPARMDRLPWSRFHWLIVFALGITWILDGLEVTIVGALASVLTKPNTLNLSAGQVGLAAAIYIAGAVIGSLFFGYLTDIFGRKRLFLVTLAVYILATVATAFSVNFFMFALFRFFTGTGIGGEYAAINSAIDELIPARMRGWVDIAINGSYWIGTIIGASLTLLLLNPSILPNSIGWRLSFGIGAVIGIAVLVVRRYVPESPRWLMTHGEQQRAEEVVEEIEARVKERTDHQVLPEPKEKPITIQPRKSIGFGVIAKTMFGNYPRRAVLGFSLMTGQAFLYNAIFFTYGLVLTTFYGVASNNVGLYLIPFAIGNVLGPWTIGRLFDTIGRKFMITFTYIIAGVFIIITGYFFVEHILTAVTQTIAWVVVFFFASAGASSAYLTVSEIFPLELRAMAIAFFYSIGTAAGGISGPLLFGALVQTKSPIEFFYGYIIGGGLMIAAGIVEGILGIPAERRSLEEIASPLTQVETSAGD